jgi:hypothetical protein
MVSTQLAVFAVLLVHGATAQSELKGSLARCLGNSGSNADLNRCLAELAEKLRPYMKVGLPDYNIPATEPMFIPRVDLRVEQPPMNLSLRFTETYVNGLSSFNLDKVDTDLNSRNVLTVLSVPSLSVNGNYRMKGNAFITQVDSADTFTMKMKNAVVKISTQFVVRSGKLAIVEDPKIEVQSADLKVNFKNLFGSEGKNFAEIVHEFINQDSDKFIKDFSPQLAKQVGTMVRNLYNEAIKEIDPSVFGLN